MKKLITILLLLLPCLALALGNTPQALAASINYDDLIDDQVFDAQTMSASQIDTFLNSFPNSCISSNHGFKAPDPTGYNPTNGFIFGSSVTAGKVIYDAAHAYGLNPQVLLATLQKEQSLVTGSTGCHPNTPSPSATVKTSTSCTTGTTTSTLCTNACPYSGGCINIAVGYGCPYYCYAADEGFSKQIVRAAWFLMFCRERAEGNVTWEVNKGSWNNSDDPSTNYEGPMAKGTYQRNSSDTATYYSGAYTLGDGTVTIQNGATAALYYYTPFKSGNSNFVTIFDSWFGSTYAPHFQATYASQSPYPTTAQGNSSSAYFKFANTGNKPWYDDVSAPPLHTYPVHLATANPTNHADPFSAGWPTNNRASGTFAHVYESDGTTLAPDQHVAQPGEIVEFDFMFSVPSTMQPGHYREYFQPVLEGSTMWNMGGGVWSWITVQHMAFQATYASQSPYPTTAQGNSSSAYFKFANTGNKPWYDDVSAPPLHTYPVHLATANPTNHADPFSAGWPTNNRASGTFAHVYESDGTTLAPDQHVAQPGEIVEFDFMFSVPSTMQPGHYREYFQPVLEGSTMWNMGGGVWLDVTVTS